MTTLINVRDNEKVLKDRSKEVLSGFRKRVRVKLIIIPAEVRWEKFAGIVPS